MEGRRVRHNLPDMTAKEVISALSQVSLPYRMEQATFVSSQLNLFVNERRAGGGVDAAAVVMIRYLTQMDGGNQDMGHR